jgi:hypothetical protein
MADTKRIAKKNTEEGLQGFTYLKQQPRELTQRQFELLTWFMRDPEATKALRPMQSAELPDVKIAFAWGIQNLKYEDRDRLIETLFLVLKDDDLKNQIWEQNHCEIRRQLSDFLRQNNRMPSRNELCKLTGLSRVTVHKHLKDFHLTAFYVDRIQQYKLLAAELVDRLFIFACNGDMSAAKLYLQAVGGLPAAEKETVIKNQQNNFVQINGMVITEEQFKRLPQDLIGKIEEILKDGSTQIVQK